MVHGIGSRGLGRLVSTACVGAVALALAPAIARAEPPTVTLETPGQGALTNQRSVIFAGTTDDPLDTVTLQIYAGVGTGGALVAEELAVPAEGGWSVQAEPLEDGTYTAIASQGAAEPGFSEEVTFTVDATPPDVTLDALPAATNDSTPSLGGTAGTDAGDAEAVSVVIYVGSSASGEEAASGSVPVGGGAWSYKPPPLADGTYTAQASQSDTAGNVGTSSASTFRVDTVAPAPLTLNPIAAAIPTATPSFEGTGGQAAGDGPVMVLVDGKVVGEASVLGGAWTLTSPHLADGAHTVRAEQVDEAGNVRETAARSFRVDTTPPAPTVTGPKASEVLKSSLVEFHGGAGSATGDLEEVTVEVFNGESTAPANLEQEFSAPRNGSTWSSGDEGPRLANGSYTVRVKQLDSVANVGASNPVTFKVDSPAPTVTLKELPRFTNDATPSFSGSADTSSDAKPEVRVKIYHGTSASGEPAQPKPLKGPASGGGWALSASEPLTDGTYTAQAEQPPVVESQQNPAGVSEATTFTVDTLAPAPTLTGPSVSSGLETVSGEAGTAPGDRGQVTAELFGGSAAEGLPIETITVKRTGAEERRWTANFAGLAGGQYTVLARQSDEAGNTGSSSPLTFTVTAPPIAVAATPTPPVASFTWVPATPTVGQSVSFVSSSTDVSSPITGFAWDTAGNGPLVAGGPLKTATFSTVGPHVVRLLVSDANGLSSTVAETVNVVAVGLRLMQPFPIVRIAGTETASGARIKLLTVQAPPKAIVAVSCRGGGCKTKSENRVVTAASKGKSRPGVVTLAFPRFQRALKAGALLQIRVTRGIEIGKYTSFKVRRKKLPVRRDACLRPPSTKPSTCPSQ
ncbi:MAG TPA: Ig-like domain-containing protein [Solirubrobacteraceae bacterium]|nr:Ig-like domain-containing protein [Solirubrobacteraceae bacterium]